MTDAHGYVMKAPGQDREEWVRAGDREAWEKRGYTVASETGAPAAAPMQGIEVAVGESAEVTSDEDGEPAAAIVDLTTLTVAALRSLAAEAGVPGASNMNKAALIDALASIPASEVQSGAEEGSPATDSAPDAATDELQGGVTFPRSHGQNSAPRG